MNAIKRQAKVLEEARNQILDEINTTKISLETAHSNFQNVSDPDLIDCYIYEMNSIHFRYKYLLRQMKEFDLTFSSADCKMN